MRIQAVALLSISTLTGSAVAQESAPEPLKGPAVVERPRPATLVQRDMGGALVRLEERPEIAAVELLGLTDEEKAAVIKVERERSTQVSAALAEHYELFLQIHGARQSGESREALASKFREFAQAVRPLLDPPLAERIAGALPEEKRARFRELVEEYKSAVIKEEAAQRGADERVSERRAAVRAEINLTFREMGQMLRATVTERRQRTEDLIAKLGATPEQGEKIRAIIRAYGEKNGFGKTPSADERRELMQRVLAELTPEQRRAAIPRLRDP